MAFSIPKKAQSITQFGGGKFVGSPEIIKMLVWNVYKGRHREKWRQDFLRLTADTDLILLQEALDDGWMPEIWLNHFPDHHWKMATSFSYRQQKTGVATGSRFQASFIDFLRGTEKEFFFGTPKVSLASKYLFSENSDDVNDHELLVINTHVVNFTTTGAFVRFVEELLSLVVKHEGPLIIGGDFNTWNFKRWFNLLRILAQYGIKPIEFDFDPRVLKLDHVFVRGLRVCKAVIHDKVISSDHYPLEVWLEFDTDESRLSGDSPIMLKK
jgi:endonuclease/exonuclease/phosphatase (EEP) superfamily protein YafD